MKKKPGLIEQVVEGELILYDPETSRAHYLNDTAARVWRLCVEPSEEMSARLRIWGLEMVPPEEMMRELELSQAVVLLALGKLHRAGLLVGQAPASISRRWVVRGLLVPLVSSLLLPATAAAASCVSSGGPCTLDAQCCSNKCVGPPQAGRCK